MGSTRSLGRGDLQTSKGDLASANRTIVPLARWVLIGTVVAICVVVVTGQAAHAGEVFVGFSKAFLPDTIGPGSTTTLQFDIVNTDAINPVSGVAFSDTLPAGVVIATPSSAFTDCTDGVLSAPDGGTTISLTGARLGIGATCTVTVNVTAADPGTYDNVSGELTSTAGSGGFASATLTVDAGRPGFSKAFAPNPIPSGGTSTLTFTIVHGGMTQIDPPSASALMGEDLGLAAFGADHLQFTDMLPAGVVVAALPNATTDCTGGLSMPVVTAGPGTAVIELTGGFVGEGAICTVEVDITAAAAGLYENTSGELLSGAVPPPGVSSGFATALLDVRKGFLVKSFTDDPVPPGGTVTLEFTINNPSRDFPATGIAFTDTIDPLGALTGLTPAEPLPKSACGGTIDFATGDLTFSGGSLPAAGSCTFTVTLAVPPVAATGSFTNTTSSITATIDGATETGDPASDDLKIVAAPILAKEFLDDPVGAGATTRLEFTITNTSTTSSATDITFEDIFDVVLPTASAVPANGSCGAGSIFTFTPLVNPPPPTSAILATLVLAGGELAAAGSPGSSCTFEITLDIATGAATGTYSNTTSVISATVDAETVSGLPASDSFDLVAAPRLTKEFIDDPVQPGGTVTLEFTLTHDSNAPGDAVDVEFTDNLALLVPAIPGLVSTGLPLADLCGPGNGTLVGTAGDTLLTFAGATLTPGEVCTFSVTLNVPATADAGSHTNTTSNVLATVLGVDTTENPGSDDLMIGGLVLTKEFTDDPVIAGGTVTLEFVITNDSTDDATDIFFLDDLDDALTGLVATGLPLGLVCDPDGPSPGGPNPGTGGLVGSAGDSLLTFSGGALMAGESCVFSLILQVPPGAASGTYVNRTTGFSATIASLMAFPNATDDLVVANEQLLLTKEFTDDPVVPGGTVTLEFTFNTLGISDSASDLAFTDDLGAALAGLVAVAPLDTGTCGGTLTGTSLLDYSGGSFTGGECSFSVTLQVPAAVPFGTTITNTTSAVTGTIDSLPVTGEPASDDLLIDFFIFTKFFDGLTKPTGTPDLSFTIENLSTVNSVTDLSFSDDLDLVVPGLVATSLPADPCGLGSTITGTSLLMLSGGNLLPGGSCTFSVDLLVPPVAPTGTFLNTTSDLQIFGIPAASPATALLSVDPPPTLSKAFLPDFIVPGGRSALSFDADNASVFTVTDLAFTDNLPAGVVVAPSADIGTNCSGGSLTAVEGSGVITLSGAELPPGGFCIVQVDVTSTIPGLYVNTTEEPTSSSGTSAAAIATLVVVGSGEPCAAPDGENLTIDFDTFVAAQEFVVCNTITVGPSVGVLGPDGDLTLRAGIAVVFGEGFLVGIDGKLTVSIEPVLIP